MTDEELDAMVRELMSRPYRRGSESSDEAAMRRQNEREQAAAAITALRAQLAEARAEIARLTDLNSTAYIDGHDAAKNEYRDEIQRLEVLNAQPHDRTALDRMLANADANALRRAALVCAEYPVPIGCTKAAIELQSAILALIAQEGGE